MTERPLLKQFGDLTEKDFEKNMVWISVHTEDCDAPWYDETDEETFRPWLGELPVLPQGGMFLVRAILELHDRTRFPGFVTPMNRRLKPHLGTMQPNLFLPNGKVHSFWSGIVGWEKAAIQAFYKILGKQPYEIWPIRFDAIEGLTTGCASGQIPGFCSIKKRGLFLFGSKDKMEILT